MQITEGMDYADLKYISTNFECIYIFCTLFYIGVLELDRREGIHNKLALVIFGR